MTGCVVLFLDFSDYKKNAAHQHIAVPGGVIDLLSLFPSPSPPFNRLNPGA